MDISRIKVINAEIVYRDNNFGDFIIEVLLIDRDNDNKFIAVSNRFNSDTDIYDY